MRLEGKVAVVTGAASGIGQAVAELFTEHGANILLGASTFESGGVHQRHRHPNGELSRSVRREPP